MTSHLAEAVAGQIGHAERLYHRLVLVVGAEGAGKTAVLRDLADTTGAPLINVGVEPLPPPSRPGRVAAAHSSRASSRSDRRRDRE